MKPAAPVLALSNIITGTKGITVKNVSGSSACIQIYEGGNTYTSYKLKVTLKSKVPGKGTKYIVINGQRCKVKGKTYVVKGTYKGKRKKKKITVKAYTLKSNVYGGAGSVGSKKVTIK